MSKIINGVRDWAIKRNINKMRPDRRVFISNIIEELLEGLNAKNDEITKWLTAKVWQYENIVTPIDEEDYIDSLADIAVFALTEMTKYGYEPNLVMKETLKEINSRKQDLKQRLDWEAEGATGKWLKDQDQDPKTLYKANYSVCKTHKD